MVFLFLVPSYTFKCKTGKKLGLCIKELKSDYDVDAFLKLGYDNGFMVDLYVEHFGYDVMEYLKYKNVFNNTGEEDVVIANMTTKDEFLNRLCSNSGLFKGSKPKTVPTKPNLPKDDPDSSTIDPEYKVKRGVVNVEEGRCARKKGKKAKVLNNNRKKKADLLKTSKKGNNAKKDSEVGSSKSPVLSPTCSPSKKWTKKLILNDKKLRCPFRLYASLMTKEKSFQIKSLNSDHKCSRNYNLGALVNYRWIAAQCAREIIKDLFLPLRTINEDIRKKYMTDVSLGQCKRAKQTALYDHKGGLIDHYEKLWEYRQALIESNPRTTCRLDVGETSAGNTYFKRMYICFKGVRDGWLAGYRKMIGLDGFRVEKAENWSWFLSLLHDDLNQNNGTGITIISDSHKGLLDVVSDWLS
nr:calcium/proton exchanger [Tanacetum cinerariifolium]